MTKFLFIAFDLEDETNNVFDLNNLKFTKKRYFIIIKL